MTWCSVTVDKLMPDCKTGVIAQCADSPPENRSLRTAFMRRDRFHGTSNGQARTKIDRKGRDPLPQIAIYLVKTRIRRVKTDFMTSRIACNLRCMLIVTPALSRRAQPIKADSAVLRAFISRIPGFRAVHRDTAIGTFGALHGAHSVARHVAYL
ncbi:hypothetical protein [Paraburkholderia xenovorans]|uniref:hypothetical protein n=1 Tax=Paraburkholderia xenovorans TaxID=36873 RepID=UPI0038BC7BAE